jgi:hypothetical protein
MAPAAAEARRVLIHDFRPASVDPPPCTVRPRRCHETGQAPVSQDVSRWFSGQHRDLAAAEVDAPGGCHDQQFCVT